MASWRSGYAEDCKSLHPGSIPGEASILLHHRYSHLILLLVFSGLAAWAWSVSPRQNKVWQSVRLSGFHPLPVLRGTINVRQRAIDLMARLFNESGFENAALATADAAASPFR